MNELVKITQRVIGGEPVNAVDARELHEALESKANFSIWIKLQIDRAMLARDSDYAVYNNIVVNTANTTSAGRPSTEYALSLDSAKQICMLSGTAKGREVRLYFIECEKRLKSVMVDLSKLTPTQLWGMGLELAKENEALKAQVEVLEPKAEAFDRLADTKGSECIRVAAKNLKMKEKDLYGYLIPNWIYKNNGCGPWLGRWDKLERGMLTHVKRTFTVGDEQKSETQVRITDKGQAKIALDLGLEPPQIEQSAVLNCKPRMMAACRPAPKKPTLPAPTPEPDGAKAEQDATRKEPKQEPLFSTWGQ
jgi:anti-repressor protein